MVQFNPRRSTGHKHQLLVHPIMDKPPIPLIFPPASLLTYPRLLYVPELTEKTPITKTLLIFLATIKTNTFVSCTLQARQFLFYSYIYHIQRGI